MSDILNYHHLRYFWAVVREDGITRASERLHVSQPAISAQLRELERSRGARLYTRCGRSIPGRRPGTEAVRNPAFAGPGRSMIHRLR